MCRRVIANTRALLNVVDQSYKHLEESNTTIQVKGRGFLSNDQLDKCKDTCEKIWNQNKDIGEMVKAPDCLSKLPAVLP